MGNPTLITICLILLPILHVIGQGPINYRLPTNTRPISYAMRIDPDLTSMTFSVVMEIVIDVVSDTDTIVMHSKDLNITRMQLYNNDTEPIYTNFTLDSVTDFLYINSVNETLTPHHKLKLEIDYEGNIGSGNVGFYRASYPNEHNNGTVRMAVTHLEATNARRVFPCYDEPIYKATFQINLMSNANQFTASNTRPLTVMELENYTRLMIVYEPTPVMSTYLVAFMISEYRHVRAVSQNKTYRTFGRPELIARGDGAYSLFVAQRGIQNMENFTNVLYPLTTMDQVPVPNEYYKIGAMENWGMVTYREKYLMYNGNLSTASEKQTIATIICHEFAHQWFGNLVTPEWWTYIWLNEGFATYFEQYITSLIEPEMGLSEQWITTNVQPALNDDALESTRPMRRLVQSPDEIDGIYDTIVYEKAGSIIRMVENFIGAEAFALGLTSYLNRWAYDNANPGNLYQSWENAYVYLNRTPTLNISDILTTWETQAGYPVINVQRNLNNGSVTLTQERFFINRPTGNDTTRWMVPINYFTGVNVVDTITWLSGDSLNMNLNLTNNTWIIMNNDRKGFYRVNYDNNNWNMIINHLQTGNFSRVSIENRAALLDDAFNLARAGRLNYSIALELATYIVNETHFVPISTFTNAYSYLDKMATGQAHDVQIRAFGIELLGAIYNRKGFTISHANDDHLTKLLKVNVNTMICHLNHTPCRSSSVALFNSWVNNPSNVIQPDMQNYVYCNGIRDTTRANWNIVLQRYTNSREDTEKGRLATALGCSSDAAILNDLLAMLVDQNSAFTQTDKMNAFTSVYTNNGLDGVNIALHFLTQNFTQVNQRISNTAKIISGVASRVTTNDQLTNLMTFIETNNASLTGSLQTTAKSAIDSAEANLIWINATRSDMVNFFRAREDSAASIMVSMVLIALCMVVQLIR